MNLNASPRARWTRRSALRMGGAGLLIGAVTGCDLLSTAPDEGGAGGAGGAGGSGGGPGDTKGGNGPEAPSLAKQVKSGKLPPVRHRLPEKPQKVPPAKRIGSYGGAWKTAMLGPSDTYWIQRSIGYEGLVNWQADWQGVAGTKEITPAIAESFTADPKGTKYTFTLRKGLRWSDGHPFTADDVVFAQNDLLNDLDLYPTQDNNPTAEKVDDQTVRFTFKEPDSLFMQKQATSDGLQLVSKPKHYLKKFHHKYNENVAELVKSEGVPEWTDLLLAKADLWQNTEIPTICAWQVETAPGKGPAARVERNPYYWKTDPKGSQLPYLDEVTYQLIGDDQVMLLKATDGDLNMHVRHINTLQNKPVLARNRDKGGYRFFDTVRDWMNEAVLMLNLTHKDPVKRELFQNRDFRIGLSHAINRKEIIGSVYQHQGKPWQTAPRPGDQLYDKEMGTQFVTYDVDRANHHLDRVCPDRDGDGIRLARDGSKVAFALDYPTGQEPAYPSLLELVERYWREVGVRVRIRPQSYGLWGEQVESNDHDALIWRGDTGFTASIILQPRCFCPAGYNLYCVTWRDWYASGGKEGEEPPAAPKRQLELYDRLKATTSDGEQARLMKEILTIAKEQFYTIGLVFPSPGYGIVGDDFHNVPTMIDGWQWPTPGPSRPEQYFTSA